MSFQPLWLQNLAAFCLQVTLVAAAAAMLAWVMRLGLPKARLAYWQLVLLICLVLPAAQPWRPIEPIAAPRVSQADDLTPMSPGTPVRDTPSLSEVTLLVLAAGAAIRLLWLLAGLASLRRFRRNSRTLDPLPPPMELAQQRLGVRADFRVSERVPGPVTFGFRRPLILLPTRVLEMPAASQEAIACHELIHVRRCDWVWTAAEELVLAVFWFHPAIWWLAGRIRLEREQVVDREAVAVTQSGKQYVEALLAVAGFNRETLLTPVTLFFEARHLVHRVTSILKAPSAKELNMPKKRLILRVAIGLCAALAVARLSVSLFPLHALVPDQVVAQEGPVKVESGMTLVHSTRIVYPEAARKQRIEGDVVAEITIDESGQVIDARILSGPEPLRRAVLAAVLQWQYQPSNHSRRVATVTARFRLPGEGGKEVALKDKLIAEGVPSQEAETMSRKIQEREQERVAAHLESQLKERLAELDRLRVEKTDWTSRISDREGQLKREIEELNRARAEQGGVAGGVPGGVSGGVPGGVAAGLPPLGILLGIKADGLPQATRDDLLRRLPVRVGEQVNEQTLQQIREFGRANQHVEMKVVRSREGGVWITVTPK